MAFRYLADEIRHVALDAALSTTLAKAIEADDRGDMDAAAVQYDKADRIARRLDDLAAHDQRQRR